MDKDPATGWVTISTKVGYLREPARYVKEANAENLYIRTGNSTRLLTAREAVEYVKQHWK